MGHFKNLEITKESEFVPEQETTMVTEFASINTLLNIAVTAMHESSNLGTEQGLREAERIRDAIFEVHANGNNWQVIMQWIVIQNKNV